MDDIVQVKVIDGVKDLLDSLRRILFREFSLLANAIEELASGR
jgi:hypothetical protein